MVFTSTNDNNIVWLSSGCQPAQSCALALTRTGKVLIEHSSVLTLNKDKRAVGAYTFCATRLRWSILLKFGKEEDTVVERKELNY